MQSTAPLAFLSVSPPTLAAALTAVPVPRRAGNLVYPLAAIQTLTVAALLTNHLSFLAIRPRKVRP